MDPLILCMKSDQVHQFRNCYGHRAMVSDGICAVFAHKDRVISGLSAIGTET
jgi:hypothetical protein